VPAGQVFGLLGPNGAGKTTTIRMLLDLIRPDQGEVYLFGQNLRQERSVLRRVGSMVEGAAFYDFLTGRRNLEVLALTSNLELSPQRFDAVLDLVDMRQAAGRRVKEYSTGMKQRMGIAAALLTDPDLVILDEPANGLDPRGINEVRRLIRRLAGDLGKTVVLSSHQLSEVEQACDRVVIIHKGRLLREGGVAELVAPQSRLRVEAEPLEVARAVLARRWKCWADGPRSLRVEAAPAEVPAVVEMLVGAGVSVFGVTTEKRTLEEFFLDVTENIPDDEPAKGHGDRVD